MLADQDLDKTIAQLAEFRASNDTHQATLSDLLDKYASLLDDHSRLRSDYEEERHLRERYKQMAKGHDRNPFVLVLVDGDGYVFEEDLLKQGAEGGQIAAKRLLTAVKDSLRGRGLEHCRVMVRVYVNLVSLSKALSKIKVAGPEKRSLASFGASFTSSHELFDFVDAGEMKDSAEFKVRATLRQFADNTQCKHIFFAGCHDVAYLQELRTRTLDRDQITLVRTPAFLSEYNKLGLHIEEFPGLFRDEPLDMPLPINTKTEQSSIATKPLPSSAAPKPEPSRPKPAELSPEFPDDSDAAICPFFKRNACKFGNNCKYLHVKPNTNGATLANPSSPHTPRYAALAEIRDWRQNSAAPKPNLPMDMPSPPPPAEREIRTPISSSTSSNIKSNPNPFATTLKPTNTPQQLTLHEIEALLPSQSSIPPSKIPVNASHHRLDSFLPPTTAEDRMRFNTRTSQRKLCNAHHLLGACPGDAAGAVPCEYDHKSASPATLACLRHIVRAMPCPRKGACRSLACLNGHVCQKPECKVRGGKAACKFPAHVHGIDLQVVEFVPGEGGGRKGSAPAPAAAAAGSIESEKAAGTRKSGRAARLVDLDEDVKEEDGWNNSYAPTSRYGSESASRLDGEGALFDGEGEEEYQWRGNEPVW